MAPGEHGHRARGDDAPALDQRDLRPGADPPTFNALPAMLIASVVSYGLNVLVLKHSILTEKVARHGYPITQEYAVDPLERLSVGAVMTTEVVAVPAAPASATSSASTSSAAADRSIPATPSWTSSGTCWA